MQVLAKTCLGYSAVGFTFRGLVSWYYVVVGTSSTYGPEKNHSHSVTQRCDGAGDQKEPVKAENPILCFFFCDMIMMFVLVMPLWVLLFLPVPIY